MFASSCRPYGVSSRRCFQDRLAEIAEEFEILQAENKTLMSEVWRLRNAAPSAAEVLRPTSEGSSVNNTIEERPVPCEVSPMRGAIGLVLGSQQPSPEALPSAAESDVCVSLDVRPELESSPKSTAEPIGVDLPDPITHPILASSSLDSGGFLRINSSLTGTRVAELAVAPRVKAIGFVGLEALGDEERVTVVPRGDLEKQSLVDRDTRPPLLAGRSFADGRRSFADGRRSSANPFGKSIRTSTITEAEGPGVFPSWYNPSKGAKSQRSQSRIEGSQATDTDVQVSSLLQDGTFHADPRHDCGIVSPVSKRRLMWDVVAFLVLTVDLWATPFELVFISSSLPEFRILGNIVTCVFAMDIAVNLSTGYIKRDMLIMQRVKSVRRYLRLWFWIDLIATIPFDQILSSVQDSDVTSMARLAKASKVLRTLRFLKLFKAVRMVQQLQHVQNNHDILEPLKVVFRLTQIWMMLAALSHVHGCIRGALFPEVQSDNVSDAFGMYYESFIWAFLALTVGPPIADPGARASLNTLILAISSERILLIAIGGSWGVFKAMSLFHENAQITLVKRDAMKYFRRHNVSVETQIQVLFSLHETKQSQMMQRHFQHLMAQHLPEELRRRICEELWSTRLLSLGLVLHVSNWNEDLVVELALLVYEEVFASKSILFKEGTASVAAYFVLQGKITVVSSRFGGDIAPFTHGTWLGEKALVNPALRRSATAVTHAMSSLMTVPAEGFQSILSRLHLVDQFRRFCGEQLWRGLCGRCGSLGDHFTHECPWIGTQLFRGMMSQPSSRMWPVMRWVLGQNTHTPKMVLKEFLRARDVSWLADVLRKMNVESLEELEELDISVLRQTLRPDENLTAADEVALSPASIDEFRHQAGRSATLLLMRGVTSEHHLLFLSHYKLEAGTEAALLRNEMGQVMREDSNTLAKRFSVPVFLDSEDLSDLREIRRRVRMSHNLALLLTQRVLTRPWVLVEIVTAVMAGVRVLPINLARVGNEFTFPDELFYQTILDGSAFGREGLHMFRDNSIELSQVVDALRHVFNRISVTYSPHRPASIRRVEIRAMLKQCRIKKGTAAVTMISKASDGNLNAT